MISLNLLKNRNDPLSILCIGAHSDDLEIGCGGSILRLQRIYSNTTIYWVVLSANEKRAEEARKSAILFTEQCKKSYLFIENYRDSFFPYIGYEIKEYFEKLKTKCSPDIIFTHNRADMHQDHRIVSELTWNSFRNNFILEYEIPKWDGDLGVPNFYVHLENDLAEKKIRNILENFNSQKNRDWFDRETFSSMMRIRGMESRSPSGYAEGFFCKKAAITLE